VIRPAPAVAVVLLGLLALSACGGDDEPQSRATLAASVPASVPASAAPEGDDEPGEALEAAVADVQKAAPRLESFYRTRGYPTELADVIASLEDVQLRLAPGNSLGAYRYDPAAVEFVLCVEHTSGAYATYDTAPMATGDKGGTGGCPAL
jgi:hypothetical protein